MIIQVNRGAGLVLVTICSIVHVVVGVIADKDGLRCEALCEHFELIVDFLVEIHLLLDELLESSALANGKYIGKTNSATSNAANKD